MGSPHWVLFHSEAARLRGATDSEIEETVRCARLVTGWAVYVRGLQVAYGNFADEVREIMDHLRESAENP